MDIKQPNRIVLQLRSAENIFLCHVEVKIEDVKDIITAFENMLSAAAVNGIVTIEHNELGLKFNGISIQKNAREIRGEHYYKTGN